jgi:hypothetical protein
MHAAVLAADMQGLLSMANTGPNSNTSHFSIMVETAPHLDGHYTIFGEAVDGFEVRQQPLHAHSRCQVIVVSAMLVEHAVLHRAGPFVPGSLGECGDPGGCYHRMRNQSLRVQCLRLPAVIQRPMLIITRAHACCAAAASCTLGGADDLLVVIVAACCR